MSTLLTTVKNHLKSPAYWLILLFVLVLIVPAIVWDEMSEPFRNKKLTNENRAVKAKPLLQIRRLQRYPKEFQAYYNDAFPFREYLVWSSRKVTGPVTNFFNARVIVGKDNYLFYTNAAERHGDESRDFKGEVLWTEGQLDTIIEKLEGVRKGLKEMGVDFCMIVAPNKMTIYSDKLPAKRKYKRGEILRAEQLIAHAKKHAPELKIFFPADILLDLRNKVDYPLFLHEDTHWNELSGYVATREIIQRVGGKKLLPPLEKANIVRNNTPTVGGDLRTQLGTGNIGEYYYHNVVVPGCEKVGISAYMPQNPYDNHCRRSRNPKAPDSRKVWVYRDSFAQAMEPYISMYFREVDYFWNIPIRRIQYMGPKKPDLVIFQVVERNIVSLDNVDFESKRKAEAWRFYQK